MLVLVAVSGISILMNFPSALASSWCCIIGTVECCLVYQAMTASSSTQLTFSHGQLLVYGSHAFYLQQYLLQFVFLLTLLCTLDIYSHLFRSYVERYCYTMSVYSRYLLLLTCCHFMPCYNIINYFAPVIYYCYCLPFFSSEQLICIWYSYTYVHMTMLRDKVMEIYSLQQQLTC